MNDKDKRNQSESNDPSPPPKREEPQAPQESPPDTGSVSENIPTKRPEEFGGDETRRSWNSSDDDN